VTSYSLSIILLNLLSPHLIVSFFFTLLRPPPRPTLFPYTTLFRSATIKNKNTSYSNLGILSKRHQKNKKMHYQIIILSKNNIAYLIMKGLANTSPFLSV